MSQILEAVIDGNGVLKILNGHDLPRNRKAIVTVLDESPESVAADTALLSEDVLSREWLSEEEDKAWAHLQPETSS
ncbi:MAG: hypothetical protein IPM50_09850 [Acidobacteriota bacterium]|nr:MAG: hypothetical protein IPM50_09850 [Acidobacteriota bacterium]